MRHVGGEGDFPDRLLLVGAGDRKGATVVLDVRFGSLQEVRGDLLPFRDDLVERFHDRSAADGNRARAVRAHAEEHPSGVSVHDVHVLDRDAKAVGNDLCECCLVPLSVLV